MRGEGYGFKTSILQTSDRVPYVLEGLSRGSDIVSINLYLNGDELLSYFSKFIRPKSWEFFFNSCFSGAHGSFK